MKALVVMPTYNEAESVLEVLDRVLAAVIIRPAGRRHGRITMDPDRVEPIWRA